MLSDKAFMLLLTIVSKVIRLAFTQDEIVMNFTEFSYLKLIKFNLNMINS